MIYDVELIVRTGGSGPILSISNNPTYIGIGALARLIVYSTPAVDALTTGDTLTIQNAAGQSVVKTLNSAAVVDSPVVGQTRLNFGGTWAQDYSAAAGGFFILDEEQVGLLELYTNETISQNWRFSDLQTFSPLGSFSRQFRVPATQKNLQIIGYLNDVNFDGDVDYFALKLPAELRVQTLPIATGYLRVMRVITQADKLSDFELTFYAESPDLFNKISGKKLKDIAALQDLNVLLDYDEVAAASGYPYLYALTDYGQKWDQTGAVGTRSIYDESVTGCMRPGDLTPSLSWRFIFASIIEEAGFTYDGVDLDNSLYTYYAPWINSKKLNYVVSEQSALFAYYLSAAQVLTASDTPLTPVTEIFDNGSNLSGTIYTAPSDGTYFFRVYYTGFINGLTAVSIIGRNLTTSFEINYFTSPFANTVPTHFDSTNSFPGVQLSAGDQFRIIFNTAGSTVTLDSGASYETGTGVELYMVDFSDSQILDWAGNAPDISQSDFLRDVFNMHCCVVVPDRVEPNKLIIASIGKYLDEAEGYGSSYDWSKKLDVSKDLTLINTSDFQTKRLTFTYSAGEDYFSKIYTSLGRIYGDYKIENYTVSENDLPNDFAKDTERKVQLITQSTVVNYINGTNVVIPKFVNSTGEFVNPKLRCLFHSADYEVSLWNTAGNFADPAFVIPSLNHYELTQPLINSNDLNWAPEVPLYIQGINPVNNLFNLYWRDYLNQLYSPNARILEGFFALDLSDILSFTFADRIWCKDAWWRILEISDYKIGSVEVTKVTLLKLIDAVAETSAVPTGTGAGGSVTFSTRGGAATAATESACNRYGYRWDSTTNTCYATTPLPQLSQTGLLRKVGSSLREVSNAVNTIVMTDELNNDSTNVYTLAVGSKITMEANNLNSVAVGENLTKQGSGGVAMFGKNVLTAMPGIHYGGGYRDGDTASTALGYAQFGTIVLQRQAAFASSGDIRALYLEGVAGVYLTLPTDVLWSCFVNYTIQDTALTGDYETGQLSFALLNVGGTAQASAVVVINTNGGFGGYTFVFDIDVVTDPAQPRLTLEASAGTFPETFFITASLHYQQNQAQSL